MTRSTEPIRVLFLCTGNSCRSQIAEGLARELSKGRIESFSAGQMPEPVSPLTIRAMAAVGNISVQQSKPIERFSSASPSIS